MYSYLEKEEGIFNPGQRFAFTNITSSVFTSKWNGFPIIVQPGETIEISDVTPMPGSGMGECLAIKMTKEIVDSIMQGNTKADELAKNNPLYRSPLGGLMGVPSARKPIEDSVLQALPEDESISAEFLKKEKANEIINDASKKEGVSYENQSQEFSEVPKSGTVSEEKPKKKALKTKKVSKK